MKKSDRLADEAVNHFLGGYNCAQSVLLTMAEHWKCSNELIPKIATGFGSGIGSCGSVCGALTGGVMAIGIKHGTNEPSKEKRKKASDLAGSFYKEFGKRHKSVFCRDLIGYDLSDPEEVEQASEAKVFDEKCTAFVRTAVEILEKLNKPH
jgi:C_GCAxxG_C_C family probable redox protein